MKKLLKGAAISIAALGLAFMGNVEKVWADEPVKYEYGDEGIINEALELTIAAEAGKDYDITVEFTGLTDSVEKIDLGYDMVSNDQMVPNVYDSEDRSGLLDETVIAGKVESRTFSVAAINDSITIKASGNGKILSISVKEKVIEEREETTIFTIGDSLVQTYTDYYAPQTGWGQTLQDYFAADKVVVRNHALGGRSSGSFIREGRLNEVLVNVNPGDYVLIEFGHNDASKQKEDRYTSVEDYKVLLVEQYIKGVEQRGGIPVLVTLVNRNDYNAATGVFNVSFERYVVAMREVAKDNDALLIDLNAKTVEYFTELNKLYGVGITEEIIFNYADAGEYTGAYADGVSDNTHLQRYGAKIVAGMVAESLCEELNIDVMKNAYLAPDTYTEIPGVPQNVRLKGESWIAGRIEWDAVVGADFYRVYVADVKDGVTGEFELAGYTTTNEYAWPDARLNERYMFKVMAVNASGESGESEEYLFIASDNVEASGNDVKASTEGVEDDASGIPLPVIIIVTIVIVLIAAVVVVKKRKK